MDSCSEIQRYNVYPILHFRRKFSSSVTPYHVINADGTPNKAGQITEYVLAYVEIGSHKTTQHLFVTNLGNKEMMIGYLYMYKHNPNIDWRKGQWEFTRCLDTCANKVCKI